MIDTTAYSAAPGRMAVWFSVTGDLRFLSHRQTLRLWQRTLVRADAPVQYSQGFNPHPRISLPLPRSVGMSSRAELLVYRERTEESANESAKESVNESAERVGGSSWGGRSVAVEADEADWAGELARALPGGVAILGVRRLSGDADLQPRRARYRARLSRLVDRTAVGEAIAEFQASEHVMVDRPARGRHGRRRLDLKETVEDVTFQDGDLCYALRFQQSGTARSQELLAALSLDGVGVVEELFRETTWLGQWCLDRPDEHWVQPDRRSPEMA